MCFYIIGLFSILMSSCSDNIEQSFKDFSEFNSSGTRLKSWFPDDLITNDCYDFKEIHNLENSNSFGKFSYKNSLRIDSIFFNSERYQEIRIDSLNIVFNKVIKPKRPNWFLSNEQIIGKKIYKRNTKTFIKDENNKTVYFIYTSII